MMPATHSEEGAKTARAPSLPPSWINARGAQDRLWASLKQARRSLLICDYDGTLAPFKADKMLATPYPGVAERLEALAELPYATLALVSGRPVAELITLFPLASRLELYGSHGREHRSLNGVYATADVNPQVQGALDQAAAVLEEAGYRGALERKAGSLAVHWRNLSAVEQTKLAGVAHGVFDEQARVSGVAVLPFESGVELRASDQTKAHAVERLLADLDSGEQGDPGGAVTAYMGDDTTDEDAFAALGTRGTSLLVREEPRASQAQFWLRPPAQLIGFLDDWLRAARKGRT